MPNEGKTVRQAQASGQGSGSKIRGGGGRQKEQTRSSWGKRRFGPRAAQEERGGEKWVLGDSSQGGAQ